MTAWVSSATGSLQDDGVFFLKYARASQIAGSWIWEDWIILKFYPDNLKYSTRTIQCLLVHRISRCQTFLFDFGISVVQITKREKWCIVPILRAVMPPSAPDNTFQLLGGLLPHSSSRYTSLIWDCLGFLIPETMRCSDAWFMTIFSTIFIPVHECRLSVPVYSMVPHTGSNGPCNCVCHNRNPAEGCRKMEKTRWFLHSSSFWDNSNLHDARNIPIPSPLLSLKWGDRFGRWQFLPPGNSGNCIARWNANLVLNIWSTLPLSSDDFLTGWGVAAMLPDSGRCSVLAEFEIPNLSTRFWKARIPIWSPFYIFRKMPPFFQCSKFCLTHQVFYDLMHIFTGEIPVFRSS